MKRRMQTRSFLIVSVIMILQSRTQVILQKKNLWMLKVCYSTLTYLFCATELCRYRQRKKEKRRVFSYAKSFQLSFMQEKEVFIVTDERRRISKFLEAQLKILSLVRHP